MSARTGLIAAPLLLALGGCPETGPSVAVRAELMRLPETVAAGSAHEAALSVPPWTSNVTLTSVRSPVSVISIHGPSVSTTLYECTAATSAGCLVELNGPALESLLPMGPTDVRLGTYDEVHIGYCGTGETGWSAQFTGTVVIGGTTYFTRTAGNQLGAVGPAQPVSISYSGCVSAYAIVPPLVMTDTLTTVLLRLYIDMRELVWAALNDASTNFLAPHPGCSGLSATGFICAAYTSIFAVPGSTLPTVERYRVNTNVTIGLVFDAADRFVGGYNRRYYIEDAGYSPGLSGDGHYDIMTSTGPGTYRLASRAPGNDFPAFQRADHSGMVLVPVGGATPIINIPYTAVRLP